MTAFRRRRLVIAVLPVVAFAVLFAALWFGGDRPRPAIEGLPSPGALTTLGLPAVRLVHDLCAVGAIGTLLAAVFAAGDRAIARSAGFWAIGWSVSAAAIEVLTLSDFLGAPVAEALRSGVLPTFLFSIPQGQAFVVVTLLTAAVAIGAFLPLPVPGRTFLLALAVFAVLPPAYVGHSASAADHNLALSSLMLHIAAVTLWVGGLFGLIAHLRGSAGLVDAVRRFSALALCCFIAVGVSGLVNAWIRVDAGGPAGPLGTLAQLWQSRYGLLVLAKIVALVLLGWFGWRHRRTTIAALETEGRRGPFLRLALGEIAVMLATMGLAVALARTAPPATEAPAHQHGALGYALAPLSPARLILETRPDPIVLLAVAGLAAGYLLAVRRVGRHAAPAGTPSAEARRWPAWRTVAWLTGLLVLAYGLAGGVAAYGPAVFAAHAAQYALLGAAGPALLALGAPLVLRRLARPSDRDPMAGPFARAIFHPWTATVAYVLPFPALYLTGLFEAAQSSLAVRLALQAWVTASAVVLLTVALGLDALGAPRPRATRAGMLLIGIAAQAWAALLLLTGPPQGALWYAGLDLPWAPERYADQRLGALLGAGIAIAVFAALLTILAARPDRPRPSPTAPTAAPVSGPRP